MRLAFRIKARAPGNSAAAAARYEKWAAMTGAEAAFRNPETKSESQHVDAVTKKKDLDVPRRQLWTELGYSQQQSCRDQGAGTRHLGVGCGALREVGGDDRRRGRLPHPETKSESQHVDAVTKKKDLDVPRRQLWTELGYSQQQVLDWEAELAAAPPEPAQPVVARPGAGHPHPRAD